MGLTKIEKPFGLLDAETRAALQAWPHGVELYYSSGAWVERGLAMPWYPNNTYRAKPAPLTKPSIEWAHVAPRWRWLARDNSGVSWLYESEPNLGGGSYWNSIYQSILATAFFSFNPGTCDWRDSLVQRPEGV